MRPAWLISRSAEGMRLAKSSPVAQRGRHFVCHSNALMLDQGSFPGVPPIGFLVPLGQGGTPKGPATGEANNR